MQRSLIVGMGQIGSALKEILSKTYDWDNLAGFDRKGSFGDLEKSFDIMHVCFPYDNDFIEQVQIYQAKYKPKYTVIHSTVKVGTCWQLNAISSPVLGIHPNLESGIKTFIKFLGGEQASEVADYFRRAGLKIYITEKSETTELMKILDTTFYGVCIEYTKDVKRQCEKYGVPFEAWTLWTDNYNKGYKELGHQEFTRPNLVPIQTSIKGHCILPNTELLETPFTELIKKLNG